ncbi:hypothetical protein [Pseudoalteromonas arctica]|uniref:RiboL-PSP-HEPN domain-containing protein n=1 Tax=Pseudoalteromonas arctica A 37-1-2 TaxID=1117313 RepID=A0A290S6F9_9GAMM|nr:hypothetical protein [Pseudoalteromonas arctica]ATC87738.1 hypothetical protein PARC_a3351 [Pseudoalteromonas arctica A 37-1-2]
MINTKNNISLNSLIEIIELFQNDNTTINVVSLLNDDLNNGYKKRWMQLAEYGWFLHWYISTEIEEIIPKGAKRVDEYMITETKSYLVYIFEKVISLYPHRKHILDAAFDLHNEGNYIASIPLIFAQTDGIFEEETSKYLFTRKKRENALEQLINSDLNNLDDISLSPLLKKLNSSLPIRSDDIRDLKKSAPNRHGILHGDQKHLDYGTQINSLKCITLLAHVANTFEKLDNKPK